MNLDSILDHPLVNKLRFPQNSTEYPFSYEDLQVNELIGSGINNVKSVLHKPSGNIMAVKIIPIPINRKDIGNNEYRIQKLKQEFEILRLLSNSPYVAYCYGVGIHQEQIFICMELMDTSLMDVIRIMHISMYVNKQEFPEEFFVYIASSIIDSLIACKDANIIHRDIKPHNILLNKNGEIKLCDFGVSRILNEPELADSTVGTFLYWPPEKLRGESYGSKADIWSLGITLLEFILGYSPFYAEDKISAGNFIVIQNSINNFNWNNLEQLEKLRKLFDSKNFVGSRVKEFIKRCMEVNANERIGLDNIKYTRLYKLFTDGIDERKSKIAGYYNEYEVYFLRFDTGYFCQGLLSNRHYQIVSVFCDVFIVVNAIT